MLQGMHVESVRPQPRHDAGSTGSAQRLLTVRRVKADAHPAKTIKIRRLHQRMIVGSEITVHIVSRNEQDVGSFRGICIGTSKNENAHAEPQSRGDNGLQVDIHCDISRYQC